MVVQNLVCNLICYFVWVSRTNALTGPTAAAVLAVVPPIVVLLMDPPLIVAEVMVPVPKVADPAVNELAMRVVELTKVEVTLVRMRFVNRPVVAMKSDDVAEVKRA